MQEQQRGEADRRAVAAAQAEAERERLSRERLEQQVSSHHSRVSARFLTCDFAPTDSHNLVMSPDA